MTTTTISLADLSEATKEYLRNEVTDEVVRVTDEVGVDEDGVISLRFTNADENRGIRLVGEMFVFFPQGIDNTALDDVLDPGEVLTLEVPYHGEGRGTTGVTAHLHGSVSTDDLFPRTNGVSPDLSIRIRR